MIKAFETIEELENYLKTKGIKYRSIIPQEDNKFFWVEDEHRRVVKFFKSQPTDSVLKIMKNNGFPSRYLSLIEEKAIDTNHPTINALKEVKGALLEGPTGTGKTTACVWKIFTLVRDLEIATPVYIGCLGPNNLSELYQDIQDADAYLLDDLNPIAMERQQFRYFIYDLIYHAYENQKRMFITSNNKIEKIIQEEPALRRLAEMCKRIITKG